MKTQDEKIRDAWEEFESEPLYPDDSYDFADLVASLVHEEQEWCRAVGYHAGYLAGQKDRNVPTENEILETLLLVIMGGADEEDVFKITKIQANRIHRLLVGEEVE